MATFREGQRVRVLRSYFRQDLVGREATVIGPFCWGWSTYLGRYQGYPVSIDGWGRINDFGNQIIALPDQLAPLTDPGSEAFIARVKSWGALKEPMTMATLTERVLAHIRGGSL